MSANEIKDIKINDTFDTSFAIITSSVKNFIKKGTINELKLTKNERKTDNKKILLLFFIQFNKRLIFDFLIINHPLISIFLFNNFSEIQHWGSAL